MTYKQLTVKSIKTIPRTSICKDVMQCNTIVVSAAYMFNKLYESCKNEQLSLFGLNNANKYKVIKNNITNHYNKPTDIPSDTTCDDTDDDVSNDETDDIANDEKHNYTSNERANLNKLNVNKFRYIYTNNYNIMIDTLFRMLYNFGILYQSLMKRFNAKRFIIINDLNPKCNNIRKNAELICPNKWKMYNKMYKTLCEEKYHYIQLIWKLKSLSKFLDEEEFVDYDCWESKLAKMFPDLYDFCLRGRPYRLRNYYTKKRLLSQFLYLVSLTQMQLSQYEMFICWNYLLKIIHNNNITIYECENGEFDYNISHIFSNTRTLFITDKYVAVENIFYYDFIKIYYPFNDNHITLKDYPDINTKLIKRTKRKKIFNKINGILDLFDVCEKECNGKILDINSAYTLNLFSNIKQLYKDVKFKSLMPDKIEETEYAWILKESYEEYIPGWVRAFNKISVFKIK